MNSHQVTITNEQIGSQLFWDGSILLDIGVFIISFFSLTHFFFTFFAPSLLFAFEKLLLNHTLD